MNTHRQTRASSSGSSSGGSSSGTAHTHGLLHLLGVLVLHALQATVGVVEQLLHAARVLLLHVKLPLLERRQRVL